MHNFLVLLAALLSVSAVTAVASVEGNRNQAAVLRLLCDASYICSLRGGSTSSDNDSDKKIQSIKEQFNRDGYAVLKGFFAADENKESEKSLVSLLGEDWHNFSIQYWTRIFQVLHEKGHISQPNHVMNDEYVLGKLRKPGYKEIVHRNPGRYEISLKLDENDGTDSEKALLYQDMPSLQPIIDKLEQVILSILKQHPQYKEDTTSGSKKYNLLYSMLIAAPGSRIQQFHFDTRHINEQEHLPAHIINVFIPLINITTNDLGPTELIPQSHIQTRFLQNPNTRNQAKELRPSVAPLMNVGDVLMFDFRILHRGLANTDLRNLNRPMLVLAFSLPSFHDTANWPGPSIFD